MKAPVYRKRWRGWIAAILVAAALVGLGIVPDATAEPGLPPSAPYLADGGGGQHGG
ncbi:hypothetical protein FKZ61_000510 [Litorilinea aerophila]|uniref:hypothetical protein n=1 Tax=Litorilinea aerophila TaxID=1204385 RepID=UPI001476DBDA|nr:hypothetical protein [Litorilinea aerophila]MCC9074595.1 hypothetical protein [Litorilinea aerophila]GIV75737.1 MAG: hypothetical protein KatS3mg050_0131 [Litorilinea sp.]